MIISLLITERRRIYIIRRLSVIRISIPILYHPNDSNIPSLGKVAPCIAKQMPKQAALTIHRMTNVHFRPEFIGCHLKACPNTDHTRLTNGMPTSRMPAIYITMADKGEAGITTSAIGKSEINAAPPPTATATAAISNATNTTPKISSIGLQTIANTLYPPLLL